MKPQCKICQKELDEIYSDDDKHYDIVIFGSQYREFLQICVGCIKHGEDEASSLIGGAIRTATRSGKMGAKGA